MVAPERETRVRSLENFYKLYSFIQCFIYFSNFINFTYIHTYIHTSGWIFEKVIDSYKPSVPNTPPPLSIPKLSSPKLLYKWQLSEYPS